MKSSTKFWMSGVSALALMAGGTTSQAADMVLKAAPAPAPVFSWTGCYVGIEGGYAWGRAKHSYTGLPPVGGDVTPTFDINGGTATTTGTIALVQSKLTAGKTSSLTAAYARGVTA